MRRLFLLALTFVIVLGASLGAFLFLSLWPYFSIIGKFTAAVVAIGLLCVAALMIAFTYTRICSWLNRRRMIVAGEVVAYLANDGTFVHLSAQHEAAKIPAAEMRQIAAPARPSDKDTVLKFHQEGVSLRDIVVKTGVSYYYVQKWTSESEKKNV